MPTSKKRIKRDSEESQVVVKNPLKTKTGKAIVIILSAGFVLGTLITLIVVMVQIAQR